MTQLGCTLAVVDAELVDVAAEVAARELVALVEAAKDAAAAVLVLGCSLLHGCIMNEHLRCGEDACPVPRDHADLFGAALGSNAADGIPGLGSPTPYHGLEALSVGASQRLPSLRAPAKPFVLR